MKVGLTNLVIIPNRFIVHLLVPYLALLIRVVRGRLLKFIIQHVAEPMDITPNSKL